MKRLKIRTIAFKKLKDSSINISSLCRNAGVSRINAANWLSGKCLPRKSDEFARFLSNAKELGVDLNYNDFFEKIICE